MAITFTATTTPSNNLFPPQLGVHGSGAESTQLVGLLNIGTPYATSGNTVAATDFLSTASTLVDLVFNGVSVDGTVLYAMNAAKTKVLAFNASGTELANGTNLSAAGKSCRCVVVVS